MEDVSISHPGMLSTFVKAARLPVEPATAENCAFYLKAAGISRHTAPHKCNSFSPDMGLKILELHGSEHVCFGRIMSSFFPSIVGLWNQTYEDDKIEDAFDEGLLKHWIILWSASWHLVGQVKYVVWTGYPVAYFLRSAGFITYWQEEVLGYTALAARLNWEVWMTKVTRNDEIESLWNGSALLVLMVIWRKFSGCSGQELVAHCLLAAGVSLGTSLYSHSSYGWL